MPAKTATRKTGARSRRGSPKLNELLVGGLVVMALAVGIVWLVSDHAGFSEEVRFTLCGVVIGAIGASMLRQVSAIAVTAAVKSAKR